LVQETRLEREALELGERERERRERERVREGERVALRRRHWIGDNEESNGHKFFGTACRRNREGLSMTKGPTWKWYRND
jgi:hypothetical protein